MDGLPSDAPVSEMTHGVLVLEVSWESLMGDIQSNDGVDEGETRVGDYLIEIPRGTTTVTIEDYTGKPVAVLHLNTSK